MKRSGITRTGSLLLPVLALVAAPAAYAWEYLDTTNRINLSGLVCRAQDGNAEKKLSYSSYGILNTLEGPAGTVRVFCPVNRRNLHAYDKQMRSAGEAVLINSVRLRVEDPSSGKLRCRLFARDSLSSAHLYGPWRSLSAPATQGHLDLPSPGEWRSVNWGVMCDMPITPDRRSEIISITADVRNDQP